MKESMRDKNSCKESVRKTILAAAWQKMVVSGEIFVVYGVDAEICSSYARLDLYINVCNISNEDVNFSLLQRSL